MGEAILQTKLYPPPLRESLVPRPHLIEKLNISLNRKLTLISAPAGFGKSTLISSWLADQPKGAWLALDQSDNEPRLFWQYMIAAIQKVESGFGIDAQQFFHSPKYVEPQPVLVSILNELSEKSLEIILVLDDYHIIDSTDVHDSLNFFLERIPSDVHLVLLTRVDPPLSLGRLRANNDLAEIRSADLQFSVDESVDLLDRVMNLSLDRDQVDALNVRTEGWVVGLQMAGLSIKKLDRSEQISAFINDFTGSHRHIFDYLTDEVLAHQTTETQSFLLQTSLLGEFNASLCEAVTGDENSQAMLEYLESSNLFLFPLDEDRRWYRYHHLFATLLQRRLRHHPDLLPEKLNLLAADWFEANGMVGRALQHLQEANNLEGMARLIKRYGAEILQPGWLNRLQSWLDALPVEIVQNDALLASLQAWIYYFQQQSDHALTWVEHVQHAFEQTLEKPHEGSAESWGTILGLQSWVACQRGDYQRGVQLAQDALDKLPSNDRIWRGKLYILLAEALAGDGRPVDSIAAYEMSFQYNQEAGNLVAASAILATIWMTKVLRGYLNNAKQELDRVIEILMKQEQSISASALRMGRLVILYEHNDLTQVESELSDLWRLIQFDSTIETARHCYLSAQYYATVGEDELAYRSLQSLEDAAASWSTPDEQARAIGGCMRIYLRLGERLKPDAWLRSVEYDPNNLTLLRNDEYLAIADVLRFSDSPRARQGGLELVDALLKYCDDLQIYGIKIEVYCLKALLLAANGDVDSALAPLEQALSAGEPEGYVRTFADFGEPMAELLNEAVIRDVHARYAAFLLTQFPEDAERKPQQDLVELLSDRELEVLSLLATHLSGPEIADHLSISINTYKTHTKNIYGKLGVSNRNKAVVSARTLDLL